ncbi:hypothetical protein [Bacteroides acidifaciens]|uniref:hypothetical protein n=1 Tax=Bacteroides acidifaciens TaxID=85831 RepID=UPI002431B805|nr:hypothetical protein [Bacteroides acidifaciens]
MTFTEHIDKQLEDYSQAFDFYIRHGSMPASMPSNEPLIEYMKGVLDRIPPVRRNDPLWTEVLKDDLMSYFRFLLKYFAPLEEKARKEIAFMQHFMNAPIEQKREMWGKVRNVISQNYSKFDVHIQGYASQFNGDNNHAVFSMLVADWQEACHNKLKETKRELLNSLRKQWERTNFQRARLDYEERKQLYAFISDHPQLTEIISLMGRTSTPPSTEKENHILTKYLPSSLSSNISAKEIDRIETGNNLECIIPSERALLADSDTQFLFYKRYATKELQQFSTFHYAVPQKTEEPTSHPRWTKGPLIVCVDTSASMYGKPEKIACSLLLQLLRTIKHEQRKCFLITFSVRSKSIDLSLPGNWNRVRTFFENGYGGETNGESMFKSGLDILEKDTYALADILIISDFCFPLPQKLTLNRIKKAQSLGTRFYGLCIGRHDDGYVKILDKMWQYKS